LSPTRNCASRIFPITSTCFFIWLFSINIFGVSSGSFDVEDFDFLDIH
jgi:hypothetical protein